MASPAVAAPAAAPVEDEDAWSIAASADTVDAADAAEASTDSEVEVCAAPPTPEAVDDANPRKASLLVIGAQSVDDEASTDVDSEAEAYVNDRRGRKAAAPPPTPYVVPHADDDDAVDEAPVELLFRADDAVFARDGREDHPATVVADCPAGAASVVVKWQSTGDQVEVSIADVTAIGALPPRSCRRPRAAAAAPPVAVDEPSEADESAEPSPASAADAEAFRPLTPLDRPSCVPPPSLSSPAEAVDCKACATGDRRRKHTCPAAARLRNAARAKPKPRPKKSVHAWRLDDDEEPEVAPRRSGRTRTKVVTYADEENDVPERRTARKRRAAANDRSPFKSANVFGF